MNPEVVPNLDDEWNLDSIRVSQQFAASAQVEPVLTRISVGKPGPADWFRVHPDEAFSITTLILETEDDTFLIGPAMHGELAKDPAIKLVTLVLAVTTQGKLLLWPLKMPKEVDGKRSDNLWNESARDAANLARTEWVRLKSNRSQGLYEVSRTTAPLAAPVWPKDLSLPKALKLAFRDRRIDSPDHPAAEHLLRGV